MTTFYHYPDWQNTYKPAGLERTPHLPMEGEAVTVFAAVEGFDGEAALKVAAGGHACPELLGKFQREENGKRFFSFALGCFKYGDTVEYRFSAGGETSRIFGFDVCRETAINRFQSVALQEGCLCLGIDNPWLGQVALSFQPGRLVLSAQACAGQGKLSASDGNFICQDSGSLCRAEVFPGQGTLDVYGPDGAIAMKGLRLFIRHTPDRLTGFTCQYNTNSSAVFGLGERFDSVNHIGRCMDAMIFEQFTNQGRATYYPIPFYYTNTGHGLFMDTPCRSEYDFGCTEKGLFSFGARIGTSGVLPDIHVLFGEPRSIIAGYASLSGKPALPPKWAFGLWVSANRWSCQRHIEEQLEQIKAHKYPAAALVIEAWSDEATFYIWNDAGYGVKEGAGSLTPDDFIYPEQGRWPDPAAMIKKLHGSGIKLVLWQIPVLKKLGAHEPANPQHERDVRHALEHELCIGDGKGGAYAIPDFWFSGSLLPDFTSTEARKWWFAKRKYLLDMGVDGFKTDGGEFIHEDGCTSADGSTGVELKNGFTASYLGAYSAFAGPERALFSRAGYAGAQRHPLHWAGDQQSTWQEMRSVLKAGLTLGMSGTPFWSFDIGGFAGPLPPAELYIRSTELAAFAPVMQWHSEPMGGQYAGTPGEAVNDRSPWNIARMSGDVSVLQWSVYYANLHRNLLPQIYCEAQKSAQSGLPVMRHLALEYPDDPCVYSIADEFLLGDLLVAPVVEEGADSRSVYLPHGKWMDVWSGIDIEGGRAIHADAPIGRIPLYLRQGGALALTLCSDLLPGLPAEEGNSRLCFVIAGGEGSVSFIDEDGKTRSLCWNRDAIQCDIEAGCLLIANHPFENALQSNSEWLDWSSHFVLEFF